jgi:mobilome CxxCx(11)CxxC protein
VGDSVGGAAGTAKSPRQRCWDSAFNAFSTAFVFERRVEALAKRVKALAFAGYVPLAGVGAFVLSFGSQSKNLPTLLWGAGIVAVAQALVSTWALIADWSGNLARFTERISINHDLSTRFKRLAESPPPDPARLQQALDLLLAEESVSERVDHQMGISPWELRAGYRAASRQFQRACATCGQVALSLEPASDCPVCGEPGGWVGRRPSWRTLPEAPSRTLPPPGPSSGV